MPATTTGSSSPLLVALMAHRVSAKVTDCDQYVITCLFIVALFFQQARMRSFLLLLDVVGSYCACCC